MSERDGSLMVIISVVPTPAYGVDFARGNREQGNLFFLFTRRWHATSLLAARVFNKTKSTLL